MTVEKMGSEPPLVPLTDTEDGGTISISEAESFLTAGQASARRMGAGSNQTLNDTLHPPPHLSPESKAWFCETAGQYDLESHHLKILVAACEAWDRMNESRQLIAKDGLTVRNRFGELKPHPAVSVERDSRIAFLRCLRELCFDVDYPEESRPSRRF